MKKTSVQAANDTLVASDTLGTPDPDGLPRVFSTKTSAARYGGFAPPWPFNQPVPSMTVHDLKSGPHRPDQVGSGTEQAGQEAPVAAPDAAPSDAVEPRDRVEVSEESRRASREQDDLKPEIAFARQAMYNIPPLSEQRAEELVERLERGHYDTPDVVLKLSERLKEDIAPRTPRAGGEAE